MQLVKAAAAELNQTPLAWAANQANIVAAIEMARAQHVTILCLPELCLTGYGCEDAFHAAGTWRTAWTLLQEILPQTRGMIVSLGMPLLFQHALYNVACLVVDGRVIGFTGKRYLAGDGIHYEPRWFKPWPIGHRAEITLDGVTYPLGDLSYDCGGVKLGFEICEDAWVANRPGSELALAGVDLILNPSASHFAFGKADIRRRFVLEGSRAFGVSYIYANLLGNEAGRAIYDGGGMIASCGRMIAAGSRFSFADVRLVTAVIDIDATRMGQARSASYRPQLNEEPLCVATPFQFLKAEFDPAPTTLAPWELSTTVKEEEFSRAVALALFDYLRKSHSQGFVVSLSGGADSAAVATLVALAVKFALGELGWQRTIEKLGLKETPPESEGEAGLVARLLSCVYQRTRNSGEVTHNAARRVAEALGSTFYTFDVDELYENYVAIVSQAIGRELTWEHDDIALQNIQARVRAPSVWLLTNLRGALLLATSNRSEAAVGYTTMDGDTCGGLSPIAGIDKAFLRHWLRWMETLGPTGAGPVPELAAVNAQTPTAELRPPSEHQTDESDLMPYDLLDAVERLAIRDKHAPLEVWGQIRLQFPQYTPQQLAAWVERFFRLWCRNQWKRERYAPSFHLDDENLDPKTWCRFPILSGGFERELAELREEVRRLK